MRLADLQVDAALILQAQVSVPQTTRARLNGTECSGRSHFTISEAGFAQHRDETLRPYRLRRRKIPSIWPCGPR